MIPRSRISNIISTLIGALVGYALSQINDTFYNNIGQLISYKWILITGLLIILVLAYFLLTKPTVDSVDAPESGLKEQSKRAALTLSNEADNAVEHQMDDSETLSDVKTKARLRELLNMLSKDEIEILQPYIKNQVKFKSQPPLNPNLSKLVTQGILKYSNGQLQVHVYEIDEYAWGYLNKNRHLVNLKQDGF